MFCGNCLHGMPRTGSKAYRFTCTHSKVDQNAPCHGLEIFQQELESLLYVILNKQAQAILNLPDLTNAGRLDVELAKQTEYNRQIEDCLEQKRVLYERFLTKTIDREEYASQKAVIDREQDRLQKILSVQKNKTLQMQMDEKTKSTRTKLAREVTEAGLLTSELVDALIERVYVYPGNQVEIVWKMKDYCMEVE